MLYPRRYYLQCVLNLSIHLCIFSRVLSSAIFGDALKEKAPDARDSYEDLVYNLFMFTADAHRPRALLRHIDEGDVIPWNKV